MCIIAMGSTVKNNCSQVSSAKESILCYCSHSSCPFSDIIQNCRRNENAGCPPCKMRTDWHMPIMDNCLFNQETYEGKIIPKILPPTTAPPTTAPPTTAPPTTAPPT